MREIPEFMLFAFLLDETGPIGLGLRQVSLGDQFGDRAELCVVRAEGRPVAGAGFLGLTLLVASGIPR